MNVGYLKKILYNICQDGYADWIPWFCDEDGDYFSVNHIYTDDEGDLCLESTDMEGDYNYEFTAKNILHRLKKYNGSTYVYFSSEDEDGDTYACDIENNWYIDSDDDGDDTLFIDCHGME